MRQLAERSGVDVGVISRVERGQYKPPKVTTIEKLARALEVSQAEEEELLLLSGRLPARVADNQQPAGPPDIEEDVRDRLAALEERVRLLEERLGEVT